MYDVIIIGAGPAGSRTAELLAKAGKQVLVIEEHTAIGEPVQCTGLISARLMQIHPDLPKNVIQNKIKTAQFFAPNGAHFSLSVRSPTLVVDRQKLDQWLADKARKAGATVKLGTKFQSFKIGPENILVTTNKGNFLTDILIGADGPLSNVRKQAGIQARYHQQIFSQKTITGKFGDTADLCFGGAYFNWFVPISKTKARSGGPSKEAAFSGDSGGVMRYGLLKSAQKDDVYLVGDAALQVKPFSCGGVVYGQIGAKCLAKAIIEGDDYNALWKAKLERPIRRGLIFCKFYGLPNWAKNLLFKIIITTQLYKKLENLDMDFY